MQENQNPLTGYFRKPEIYIKLPTRGKYYRPGSIDLPENGEIGIFPMTAKDELLMKTPDALLNGSGTVEVIKSCVPAIKDPWGIPSLDLDVLLISIRIATYGNEMEILSSCPKCGAQQNFDVDLGNLIAQSDKWHYHDTLDVNGLTIKFKPLDYSEMTHESLRQFEESKIMRIVNDETMADDQKQQLFNDSFMKMTAHTISLVSKTIKNITSPDGNVVEDRKHIQEFIENADRSIFGAIQEHLEKVRLANGFQDFEITCDSENCKNVYKTPIVFDQSNFFG